MLLFVILVEMPVIGYLWGTFLVGFIYILFIFHCIYDLYLHVRIIIMQYGFTFLGHSASNVYENGLNIFRNYYCSLEHAPFISFCGGVRRFLWVLCYL